LLPPVSAFELTIPLDAVAVATFLIASLTISGLVSKVRKQAEQKLRETEERLCLAVRAGRMYAFEWDMASDVIVRTGQCGDILNWMDDPTRDMGQQFVARIHPDDRETYLSPKTRLTRENPNYRIDYRLLHPNGNVIWLEANGRVFFDGQGRRLRLRRHDGEHRWVFDQGVPRFNFDGSFAGYIGSCMTLPT
jgi:PAS domain-containing protein